MENQDSVLLGKSGKKGFEEWHGKEFQMHQVQKERLSEKCQFLRILISKVTIIYMCCYLSLIFKKSKIDFE